jgi:nicotinamide-nucleotide amidase
MTSAEIIAIGTELLLGSMLDTNSQFLATELNKSGIDIFRWTIIGDNIQRIQQAICESFSRAEIVITTGGLGPTIDDPTREAVAQAFGVELEFHPDLWQQIINRFQKYGRIPTENNRRQAYLPKGAQAIENSVGTAPAFIYEDKDKVVISLPGVPAEMKYLFQGSALPYLVKKFNLKQTIHSVIVHTAGMGESQIDALISDLEGFINPTIGLAAHPGQVDIRVTAKAVSVEVAKKMIDPILIDLNQRLGEVIYGYDEESLEQLIKNLIIKYKTKMILILTQQSQMVVDELKRLKLFTISLERPGNLDELEKEMDKLYNDANSFVVGIDLDKENERMTLNSFFKKGKYIHKEIRHFASHPSLAPQWVINSILNSIRWKLP